LALAVAGVLIAKNASKKDAPLDVPAMSQMKALPRLVDLGAGKCIPCKMMAPILEDLRTTLAGKLDVEFIDVWQNPDAGKTYGITVIPTQIFYDARGKELFRHEGFYGKDDILAKWKEFGVNFAM
jgi:thioredoxin 1